jgi:hypothetical protein
MPNTVTCKRKLGTPFHSFNALLSKMFDQCPVSGYINGHDQNFVHCVHVAALALSFNNINILTLSYI